MGVPNRGGGSMGKTVESWFFTDKKIELFGEMIRQSWADLFFINRILSKYRFERVIELGTGHGMLTVFLAMHSRCPVHSVELRGEPRNEVYRKAKETYDINFHMGDCFEDHLREELGRIIKKTYCLIYCDNGDKPKELETYAQYMTEGDVIMVHDKYKEVEWSDIRKTVKENKLKKFHQPEADYLNTAIWSFIKT
jgi:cephalosporin hydroxylase